MEIIHYIKPLLLGSLGHLILNYILRILIKFPEEYKKIEKKKLKKQKINQFLANYTCILHAVVMTIYGLYGILVNELSFKGKLTETDIQFYLFSIGYNIFDLIYEYWSGLLDINYVFHHTLVIIMSGHSIFLNKNGSIINFTFFLGEMTNPFICLHKNLGLYPTWKKISDILGFIFCVLFLFIRVVILIPLMFYSSSFPEVSYFVNFIGNLMVYIGLIWSFEIFNKMLKAANGFIVDSNEKSRNFYERFKNIRNTKIFKKVFQTSIFLICFIPFVAYSHNEYI